MRKAGRPIYANCLLFAVWYWVRHPFTSRIVTRRSRHGWYPHFMVLTATELIHLRSFNGPRICGPLLWRGRIVHHPIAVYHMALK